MFRLCSYFEVLQSNLVPHVCVALEIVLGHIRWPIVFDILEQQNLSLFYSVLNDGLIGFVFFYNGTEDLKET